MADKNEYLSAFRTDTAHQQCIYLPEAMLWENPPPEVHLDPKSMFP
jgi:hypothetical protein